MIDVALQLNSISQQSVNQSMIEMSINHIELIFYFKINIKQILRCTNYGFCCASDIKHSIKHGKYINNFVNQLIICELY